MGGRGEVMKLSLLVRLSEKLRATGLGAGDRTPNTEAVVLIAVIRTWTHVGTI